ncbi:hypothetical protein ACWDV4_05675 [Micromonospora sp. NPDC003197]
MTGNVGDVVAQLLNVRNRLAEAAVTAMRAKADADHAQGRYVEAADGTDHPQIREAIADIRTASEKSAKYARLLEEARESLAKYIGRIAPGVVSSKDIENAMPSGERLISEADRRSEAQRNVDALMGMLTRKVEDVQEAAKSSTKLGKQAIKLLEGSRGPTGSEVPKRTKAPAVVQGGTRTKVDVPEAAGHLVVVGLVVGIAVHKVGRLARRAIERLQAYGRWG